MADESPEVRLQSQR